MAGNSSGGGRRSSAARWPSSARSRRTGRSRRWARSSRPPAWRRRPRYRLATELVEWGALDRVGRGRYRVGLRLWQVGSLAPQARDLRDVALPFLQDLLEVTREVVHLVVLDEGQVLYIERLMSRPEVQVQSRVARRLPLHATGPGKVLLAHAPSRPRRAGHRRRAAAAGQPHDHRRRGAAARLDRHPLAPATACPATRSPTGLLGGRAGALRDRRGDRGHLRGGAERPRDLRALVPVTPHRRGRDLPGHASLHGLLAAARCRNLDAFTEVQWVTVRGDLPQYPF